MFGVTSVPTSVTPTNCSSFAGGNGPSVGGVGDAVCGGVPHPNANTKGRNKRAPVRGLFLVRRISTTSSLCPGFSGRGGLRENILEPRVAAEGSEVGIALDLGGAIAARDRALEEPKRLPAPAEDFGHDGGALQNVGVVRGERKRLL